MPQHTVAKRALNRTRARARTSPRKANSGASVKTKSNKGPGRKTTMRKTRK